MFRFILIFGLIFSISGCASTSDIESSSEIPVTGDYESAGVIYVGHPRGGADSGFDLCGKDPIVEESFSTLDLPRSSISFILRDDVEPTDVMRLVECFRNTLSSGEITLAEKTERSGKNPK